MYAVMVEVEIQDEQQALQQLHEQIVPMVKQQPGFVAGYWLAPKDGRGRSLVAWESEEAAKQAVERARSMVEGGPVSFTAVDMGPVEAHA